MIPDLTKPYTARVLTAPEQIAASIKELILEQMLKPGDRLPREDDLAAHFGVSKPTLRLALRSLAAAQILEVKYGRSGGYSVAEVSLERLERDVAEHLSLSLVVDVLTPENLWEVRRGLALVAARGAAERRTDDDLARLEAIWPVTGIPTSSRQAIALDMEFHRRLASCSANPLIVSMEGATIAAFARFIGKAASAPPQVVLADIPDVIQAVAKRDPSAAEAAIERHLEHSARHFGFRKP